MHNSHGHNLSERGSIPEVSICRRYNQKNQIKSSSNWSLRIVAPDIVFKAFLITYPSITIGTFI